jgi:hypothetical protein
MVAVQDKRSNLQSQPEIKFNSKPPPNYTQILKAAVLKFKAKHPSKSKNQSVKFKSLHPSRKQ